MIRVLVIIAVTGFLVSVVCLTTAVGIVGPEAIANGAWSWRPGEGWNFGRDYDGWGIHYHHQNDGDRDADETPTTRQMVWTGGDSIDIDLPADVKYTQEPGPAKLVITGPREAVGAIEIDGNRLRLSHGRHHDADFTIVMTAPSIKRFEMSGSGKLAIAGYKQDTLSLDLSGDADVMVTGEAKAIDLGISGSGSADLSEVKAKSAEVNIAGSGDATLAPSDAAKLDISGSGDVTLLTHPAKLESNITGSGGVRQEERGGSTSSRHPKKTAAGV